jgi:hypothetical protein
MFDRITLPRDLIDCRGGVLARRGAVVSPESIAEAARRASPGPRRPLPEADVDAALTVLYDPAYRHLFPGGPVTAAVEQALLAIRLPDVLHEELAAIRVASPSTHQHAAITAAVTVRMLVSAVGASRGVPDLAAAALLHDLGMRHLPGRLTRARDPLRSEDAAEIASHPLLGAHHLATVLGAHPAVQAAHAHHWRCGQGYPALPKAPPRAIEVIGTASAFAALTQPRPFRSAAYDARGAADVLVQAAAIGHADVGSVKLLVHALRGGKGDPRAVVFGKSRAGHEPEVNRHVAVTAPPRSPV